MQMEAAALIIAIVATMFSAVASWIAFHAFRSQTDPNVIVYVEHDQSRPSIFLLVIENIGNGQAEDVKFTLPDNFLIRSFGMEPSSPGTGKSIASGPLVDGIKMLPPKGKRIITWGQMGGLLRDFGRGEREIKIEFFRKNLLDFKKEYFVNRCPIELDSFLGTDATGRTVEYHLDKISKVITKTQKELSSINKKIERHLDQ